MIMSSTKSVDINTYKDVIQEAFTKHYTEGSDVWSKDDSLVDATKIAWGKATGHLIRKDLRLLDIGCGNGRHVLSIPEAQSYTGIDLYANDRWDEFAAGAPFPVEFLQGDFVAWASAQKQRFDLILDNGCFHHQHPDEHVDYLRHIAGLLTEDGLFSVVVWGEVFKEGNIDDYGRYHLYFSPEDIGELLEGLSFQVMEVIESTARIGKRQLQVIARKK